MPRRGQSRALQEAEEVRLAHVEAFSLEGGADDGQGGPLAAELAGSVSDPIALRRRLGPGPGGREEGVDVGVRAKSRTIARTVSPWSWNRRAMSSAGVDSRK